MKSLFDIQERVICHKNDPKTSFEAAEKMVKSKKLQKQERLVYIAIQHLDLGNNLKEYIRTKFTAKELADIFSCWDGIDYHVIQRRLSGLHRKGYIERTGEKRNGCAVWRLK